MAFILYSQKNKFNKLTKPHRQVLMQFHLKGIGTFKIKTQLLLFVFHGKFHLISLWYFVVPFCIEAKKLNKNSKPNFDLVQVYSKSNGFLIEE